ncbi:MAG: DUF302 domain-containing protein [Poseidonibacter sp.]|uniref:DUF302 domain-containing protein n=1 Tax=Poseidonibacter sp. TaxID=2321188 RepID=UPI00359EE806
MFNIKKHILILFVLFLTLNLQASYIKTVNDDYITYDVKGKYSDISFTILDEIEQNGFIFAYRAKIGNALKKISSHYKKEAVFTNAEKIGFCKMSLTFEMMEINPNNIMYCPLSIAIYELKDKKDEIRIIYNLAKNLQKDEKIMNKVNQTVVKMIENSIQ